MVNTLDHTLPRIGTVIFASAPVYGVPKLVEMPSQRQGRDSSSGVYIYQSRADTRCLHRLTWKNGTAAIVQNLLLFQQMANGCKHDFIWTDHQDNNRLVRFPKEPLTWHQTGPDRYTITIGLEENILMALVDENGTILIDETGDVLTW